MAVVIDGDRLYIADNAQGLWIADISNPTVPEVLGTVQLKTPAAAVAVKDDTACVVSMHGLLVLIDVADPANPRQVGELALPQMSAGIALKDQFALVAAGMEGLWVVDVSDPAAPKKVASQPAIFADGIVVEGGSGLPDRFDGRVDHVRCLRSGGPKAAWSCSADHFQPGRSRAETARRPKRTGNPGKSEPGPPAGRRLQSAGSGAGRSAGRAFERFRL